MSVCIPDLCLILHTQNRLGQPETVTVFQTSYVVSHRMQSQVGLFSKSMFFLAVLDLLELTGPFITGGCIPTFLYVYIYILTFILEELLEVILFSFLSRMGISFINFGQVHDSM